MNTILEKLEESTIWKMVRLAFENDALNLAQNTYELATPTTLKDFAREAIEGDFNGYTITSGREGLRKVVAGRIKRETGVDFDPKKEVLITYGASEGLVASMFSLIESENGVVIPEPFFESYLPVVRLSRGKPIFLSLHEPKYSLHLTDLKKLPPYTVFILNNPHNPTGKVFKKEEIETIGNNVLERDGYLLVDETYKYIVYDDKYVSPLEIPDLVDKTVLVGSLSVPLSVAGWRIGYVVAKEPIMTSIKKVHEYNTICAPTPFQWACENFEMTPNFIKKLQDTYREKRDLFCRALKKAGFKFTLPQGAYYVLADFRQFWEGTDWGFATFLVKNKKIAVVPGSAFYFNKKKAKNKVRFSFSQSNAILTEATNRLLSGIK